MGYFYVLILVLSFVSGCGIVETYAEPELISGDTYRVSFVTGSAVNPGPAASAYCRQHGKSAVLVGQEPVRGHLKLIFTFDCR